MYDHALEHNRRVAWAKFYSARAECETMTLWAGELAAWLDQLDIVLPEPCRDVIALVSAAVPARDRLAIARYVTYHSPRRREPVTVRRRPR